MPNSARTLSEIRYQLRYSPPNRTQLSTTHRRTPPLQRSRRLNRSDSWPACHRFPQRLRFVQSACSWSTASDPSRLLIPRHYSSSMMIPPTPKPFSLTARVSLPCSIQRFQSETSSPAGSPPTVRRCGTPTRLWISASSTASPQLTLGSSVPLIAGDILVGALTLYGQSGQEITVGQRRALESLLPTIAGSLHDALQRPSISIDCRQPHIRAAALSAMDSLLSHNRQATQSYGAALAISVQSTTTDSPRAQLSLDSGVRSLAALLSPRQSDNRCVVRFSPDNLLVCALDGATTEILTAEAERLSVARALQSFTLTLAPVRTSLELQDRVRRMLEPQSTIKNLSGARTN